MELGDWSNKGANQTMAGIEDVFFLLSFLFGLVLGAFLNVIAYRVPRLESVVTPRSHCATCHHTLAWYELIPILSWLALRARCRHCGTPISVRYPVLELTTGLVFTLTYLRFSTWSVRCAWDVFWLLLVAMMGTDLTSMRVPNVLSYPSALLMLVISGGTDIQTWSEAIWGSVVGFSLIFLIHLFSRGNMGMGDAKLYLTIGAMLGPLYTVESFVLASLSGALVGLLMRLAGLIGRREYIPFVPHIVVGVVIAVFWGPPLTTWYLHQVAGV